jgi:hypothetical protein
MLHNTYMSIVFLLSDTVEIILEPMRECHTQNRTKQSRLPIAYLSRLVK